MDQYSMIMIIVYADQYSTQHFLFLESICLQADRCMIDITILLFLLSFSASSLDYQIPTLSISSTPSTSTHYYLNDIQYQYEDEIVRIKLTGHPNDTRSYNIYNYQVIELQNYAKLESDEGNGLCSVVKALNNSLSKSKYLLNYYINDTSQALPDQKFISTAHISQNSKYAGKGSWNGAASEVNQQQLKVEMYSLTNFGSLHKVTVVQSRLSIRSEGKDFGGDDRNTKNQIYKYGAKFQQNPQMELHQLDGSLVILSLNNQTLSVSSLKINDDDHFWEFQPLDRVNLPTGHKAYRQTKSLAGAEGDRLFLLTDSSVYQIRRQNSKLELSKLKVEGIQFTAIHPVYLAHLNTQVPYLFLCDSKELLIYNLESAEVEHRENFMNMISMDSIQHISYALNDIQINSTTQGVVEMVVVHGRKQFVVEMFHDYQRLGLKSFHGLHVNKIFHNYHANTNQPYGFDLEQQPENINTISKILHPSTPSEFSNNLGLLQSRHKIIYFQYGIPRTISPAATAASEFIKEETYSNIVDVSTLTFAASTQIQRQKAYSENWLQAKILEQNNKMAMPSQVESNQLMGYIVTLDKYVNILQANPRRLYYYQYVCNLHWRGGSGELKNPLNSVKIRMESLCEQNTKVADGTQRARLVYCEEEQIINFHVKRETLQQQRDQSQHIIFACIGLLVVGALSLVSVKVWRRLGKEAERLRIMRSQRRMKLMEHSKLENEINHNKS